MALRFVKADWGMNHLGNFKERVRYCADAGYHGVEAGFPGLPPCEVVELFQDLKLEYVAMVHARDERELESQLRIVGETAPTLVNCQLGRDHYPFERGVALVSTALELAEAYLPCSLLFETHRQTLFYAPWATARYLEALPGLQLTADLSHFTCVTESDLEWIGHAFPSTNDPDVITAERRRDGSMQSLLAATIAASRHIHARVGHAQGPQVADPRCGEGLWWTQRFEAWWDEIIRHCGQLGLSSITVNPEFGPPPYAPTDPRTGHPFVDIWDVSLWICDRFRQRWGAEACAAPVS